MTEIQPHIDAETLAHLRQLARSRPKSGRARMAKISALRTLERLEREQRRYKPDEPVVFPWEFPDGPDISLYLWSEVERVLVGHLPGTGDELRHKPEAVERQVQAVCDVVLAADDSHAAFRRWYDSEASRQAVSN
jgi:hypothetical protein